MNTFDKIAKVVAEIIDIDVTEITEETTLEDLGFDDLDAVELLMIIEKEFAIPDSRVLMGVTNTIGMIAKYVDSHGAFKLVSLDDELYYAGRSPCERCSHHRQCNSTRTNLPIRSKHKQ